MAYTVVLYQYKTNTDQEVNTAALRGNMHPDDKLMSKYINNIYIMSKEHESLLLCDSPQRKIPMIIMDFRTDSFIKYPISIGDIIVVSNDNDDQDTCYYIITQSGFACITHEERQEYVKEATHGSTY